MHYVAGAEDAGQRVDAVVAHRSGRPRSLIAQAVSRGQLRVNGEPVKGRHLLAEGDTIECTIEERPILTAQPEAIDLSILFEDADVIVVDKPAGMVTHPAHGATSGTLVNALLAHVRDLPGDALRPGLVHRLDRDTSGLLVVAKTQRALSTLGKAMKARHISRVYLGLVTGVPMHPSGTVQGAIGRDPQNRLRYAIVADGRPATTHYEVRERYAHAAELRFTL